LCYLHLYISSDLFTYSYCIINLVGLENKMKMDVSSQEENLINLVRRLIPYERIEIMKDNKGNLGSDLIVFRSSKVRLTTMGNTISVQMKSIIGKPEGE